MRTQFEIYKAHLEHNDKPLPKKYHETKKIED